MGHMNDVLSLFQFEESIDGASLDPFFLNPFETSFATQSSIAADEDTAARFFPAESTGESSESYAGSGCDAAFGEYLTKPLRLRLLSQEHHDVATSIGFLRQCCKRRIEGTLESFGRDHRQLYRPVSGFRNQRIHLQSQETTGTGPEGVAQLISLACRPLTDQEVGLFLHLPGIPDRHDAVFGQHIEQQLLAARPAAYEPGFFWSDGQNQQIEITDDTTVTL